MVIPNPISAVLDVIYILPIDTISGHLVLSNKWHLLGLSFIWLLPNQLKTFVDICNWNFACNSEMTVEMSVAHK